MESRIIFAIDGGGTKSRIVVATMDGTVLARLDGPATNPYAMHEGSFCTAIGDLIIRACEEAKIQPRSLAGGCIGNAGLARDTERGMIGRYLNSLLGGIPLYLTHDAEILLAGALGSAAGICLISGTGSVALGKSLEGNMARAGGLGWRLGDEGSAWWIAQQAVSRTLRSIEGRDLETTMLPSLLECFSVNKAEEFIPLFNGVTLDKAAIAAAAPIVSVAAGEGDALAQSILDHCAKELVALVSSIVDQLPALYEGVLAYAGGVLENDRLVRERVSRLLNDQYPALQMRRAQAGALEGAVLLAKDVVLGNVQANASPD